MPANGGGGGNRTVHHLDFSPALAPSYRLAFRIGACAYDGGCARVMHSHVHAYHDIGLGVQGNPATALRKGRRPYAGWSVGCEACLRR